MRFLMDCDFIPCYLFIVPQAFGWNIKSRHMPSFLFYLYFEAIILCTIWYLERKLELLLDDRSRAFERNLGNLQFNSRNVNTFPIIKLE